MAETNHTPGPWDAHLKADGDYQIRFGNRGNWLAEVFDDNEPFEGRTAADASLIAAAPDLLEALRTMELAESLSEIEEALRVGRAAISKAEGR